MNPESSEQTLLSLTHLERAAAYSAAGALSELIEPAADAVTVFEDGDRFRVDAYYACRNDAETSLQSLKAIDADYAAAAGSAAIAPVEQQNWVKISQAALPPVYAGRFTICGSHDLHRVPRGRNTIVVDAGEAFGTAHHATTYGCLLAIDRITRSNVFERVLDLGCGSGILALAMARALPHAQITGSDIDARSVEVAAENALHNGLDRRSGGPDFLCADGTLDPRIGKRGPFDLIVANILAGPLLGMAPAIVAALQPGGSLLLSGILVQQAREIVARYAGLGLQLEQHDRHNGWSTLEFRRRPRGARPHRSSHGTLYMPAYD